MSSVRYVGPTEGREWRLGGPQNRNAPRKFHENRSKFQNLQRVNTDARKTTQNHTKHGYLISLL